MCTARANSGRSIYQPPEDIRSLDHGETVCRFCGVSYLVHHEIKKLEDKLQRLENDLKTLESQKQTCDATALRLREELAESEGEREAAGSQRNQAREQLSSTTEQCALLQDQLQKKETQLEHARTKEGLLADKLSTLRDGVQHLTHSRAEITNMLAGGAADLKALEQAVLDACVEREQAHQQVCRQLQSELATAQQELAEGELRATQLEGHWRSEVEALKETTKASALQCTALQNQLNATRQELKDSLLSAAAERKHASAMAERVRKVEAELSHLQSTSDEQCSHNDQEIARLKEALQATHDESQLYAKTTAKLLQAKEEETAAMQREFASKLEEVDRSYRWSQDELSRERNKARLLLSSHTKDKLEFEREHEQVLAWNRDLKKEVERVQAQLKQAQSSTQAKLIESKSMLAVSELQHKREVEQLQDELQREKGISEQELGRHVEQVRELELQLTRQRRAGEEGREEVAAGLARLKLQLREREGQCATLEEKLALAYREITALQGTVERECEERRELVAKLKLAMKTTTTTTAQQQRHKQKNSNPI